MECNIYIMFLLAFFLITIMIIKYRFINLPIVKELRNPKLGLWVSQSLDEVTSQKYI